MRVHPFPLIVCFLAISACSNNHDRVNIKVVDGQGRGIANAAVVIGNRDGVALSHLTTDNAGEARYYSMPASATVTAAVSCYSPSFDRTYYFVNTTYQVNGADLTLPLEACPVNDTRQVEISVTNLVAGVTDSDITLGAITYSGPVATLDVASGLQDDGTVSVFASGYDAAGEIRGYGFALDQPAVDGGSIPVAIDRTDLSRHSNTLVNVPANTLSYYVYASLLRGYGATNLPYNFTFGAAPAPATVTTYAADSFSEINLLGATVMLDQNNDGAPDGNAGLIRYLRTAAGQIFDFSLTPALPGALAYEQGNSGRPNISWANNDSRSTVNTLTFTYRPLAPERSLFQYTMTAPGSVSALVFPELPEELAAFRPRAYDNLSLQSLMFGGRIGYGDYLAAIVTHGGRFHAADGMAGYGFAAISRVP